MVRFKVIKGSHLLVGLAILLLIAVVLFIIVQSGYSKAELSDVQSKAMNSSRYEEAEAATAFASLNAAKVPLKIEIIVDDIKNSSRPSPTVLIYHTHTHEAYEQEADNPYDAIEAWRTADERFSVVHIGEALASKLREHGLAVVHDKTDFEQDSLDDSYVRSLKALEAYDEEFDLCIDLHRDAYSEGLHQCLETENGEQYAQVMLLVGRGDNYDAENKPNYDNNLAFAQELTSIINAKLPGMCRNVTVKQGRYNQHIGKNSVLIEVGHNRNTLRHALNSVPFLAASIVEILQ